MKPHLEDLGLLKHLARNVEGKVLRVHDALDEVEVLGNELLAVLHDEDAANVELDVVLVLAVLEEVERGAARDVEQGAELELALDGEVLDGEVLLPVVGEALVKLAVLLLGDVVRVAGPDGLRLVELLVFDELLLDFLLLLLVFLVLVFVLSNVFDLRCVFLLLLVTFLLLFFLVVRDLLVAFTLNQQPENRKNENV